MGVHSIIAGMRGGGGERIVRDVWREGGKDGMRDMQASRLYW